MTRRVRLSIFFCFISALAYCQDNYFVKTDGTKVQMHLKKSDIIHPMGFLTDEWLYYFDVNEKQQSILQLEVKEMLIDNAYYTQLPITKKYNRLLKVIATNDGFIASTYYSDGIDYLYIHDKKMRTIAADKIWYDNSTNYSRVLPTLKECFPNCSTLFTMMETNSKAQDKMKKRERMGPFENINNLTCE